MDRMEQLRTRFHELEAKRQEASSRLTAREWDMWAGLFKTLDPGGYLQYQNNARRAIIIREAREVLTVGDLKTLLKEKEQEV